MPDECGRAIPGKFLPVPCAKMADDKIWYSKFNKSTNYHCIVLLAHIKFVQVPADYSNNLCQFPERIQNTASQQGDSRLQESECSMYTVSFHNQI